MVKPTEHYVYIPESTMLHDKYKALKPHTKLLYSYLILRRAGRDDWFSYSYKEIRTDSALRFEMIAVGVKQLSKGGFIEYQHGGLELNHNMYYLDPAWLIRD